MFSRILGIPLLLGAAVAVPYLATNGMNFDKLWQKNGETAQNNSTSDHQSEANARGKPLLDQSHWDPPPRGPGADIFPVETPLEGTEQISLHEVFRFDITKEWVYQHWARKSTGLGELGFFGVRVPLVTGTELSDLAGSLTYYFDDNGSVQRISFHGHTGDTTQLVMLMVQKFGLQRQETIVVGEQVFQVRQGVKIYSELRTRPAPVLWSSSPHDSFTVDLELQRPGSTTPLPKRALTFPDVKPLQTADASQQSEETQEQEPESSEDEDPSEKMEIFFPRSKIPSPQVEGLNRRNRYW